MVADFFQTIVDILQGSGYAALFTGDGYLNLIMIGISFLLLYLGIKRGFEPLLMVPIAFGMLLANLPLANLDVSYHSLGEFAQLLLADGADAEKAGLLDILYFGVKAGIYPPLIFMGIGAMTDFAPLIANPKSFLLGAAAQGGIFVTFIAATLLGFDPAQAGSIAIIGGADGPTAIYVTSILAPTLLGSIAVAAYSYMALVPITTFASQLLPIVMIGGFFLFHSIATLYIGVAIYLILAVFQLVTLPVEFNASTRAKAHLSALGIVGSDEAKGVENVLDSAAFTYVAAFVSSLGWLLYMLAAASGRRD